MSEESGSVFWGADDPGGVGALGVVFVDGVGFVGFGCVVMFGDFGSSFWVHVR